MEEKFNHSTVTVLVTETEKWLYRIILTHILPVMWLSSLYRLLFVQSNCCLRPISFCWSTLGLHEAHANIFLVHSGLFDAQNCSKTDWKNFFHGSCCKLLRVRGQKIQILFTICTTYVSLFSRVHPALSVGRSVGLSVGRSRLAFFRRFTSF